MRNRSQSMYVDKAEQRKLSLRFEGVQSEDEETENVHHSDNADESEQPHVEILTLDDDEPTESWTRDNYHLLLRELNRVIPAKEMIKGKKALTKLHCYDIKIPGKTADSVKEAAIKLFSRVRAHRSLIEMLPDVEKEIDKCIRRCKPKNPKSAYNFYLQKNYKKFREANADLKPALIFTMMSKKFKMLSEKKRKKYDTLAAKDREGYEARLQQYYEDFPEQTPKRKPVTNVKRKTPFGLFCFVKQEEDKSLKLADLRAMWDVLAIKKKVIYIQQVFAEDTAKKLSKKDLETIDRYNGKPMPVGKSLYDFFTKNVSFGHVPFTERAKKRAEQYKALTTEEQNELVEKYMDARKQYVMQYQTYIEKLEEPMKGQELEYLHDYIKKSAIKAKAANTKKQSMLQKSNVSVNGLDEQDTLPIAESTVRDPESIRKVKKQKRNDEAMMALSLLVEPSTPTKKASKSILKSPSPKKNGLSVSASSSSVKRPSEPIQTKSKKAKAERKRASEPEPEPQSESETDTIELEQGRHSILKKPKRESSLLEPVKPPKSLIEFYKKQYYKGKENHHLAAFSKISSSARTKMEKEYKAIRKQYVEDLQVYLESLPKEKMYKYVKAMDDTLASDESSKSKKNYYSSSANSSDSD